MDQKFYKERELKVFKVCLGEILKVCLHVWWTVFPECSVGSASVDPGQLGDNLGTTDNARLCCLRSDLPRLRVIGTQLHLRPARHKLPTPTGASV